MSDFWGVVPGLSVLALAAFFCYISGHILVVDMRQYQGAERRRVTPNCVDLRISAVSAINLRR